jgi:hypothetical protein
MKKRNTIQNRSFLALNSVIDESSDDDDPQKKQKRQEFLEKFKTK